MCHSVDNLTSFCPVVQLHHPLHLMSSCHVISSVCRLGQLPSLHKTIFANYLNCAFWPVSHREVLCDTIHLLVQISNFSKTCQRCYSNRKSPDDPQKLTIRKYTRMCKCYLIVLRCQSELNGSWLISQFELHQVDRYSCNR